MEKNCDDPNCYNHDQSIFVFCNRCLTEVVNSFTWEEIYEIFINVDAKFDAAIKDGEAHGLLTPRGKKGLLKSKYKWFNIINKIMRKKWRNEN